MDRKFAFLLKVIHTNSTQMLIFLNHLWIVRVFSRQWFRSFNFRYTYPQNITIAFEVAHFDVVNMNIICLSFDDGLNTSFQCGLGLELLCRRVRARCSVVQYSAQHLVPFAFTATIG